MVSEPDKHVPMDLDSPSGEDALTEARRAIEAMVMVATDPMPDHMLAQIIEIPTVLVRRLCLELAESYKAEGRGFEFVDVAGGWRYQSHPECSPYVERFVLEGQTARLSTAALETLAIVAYKQPISRAQVSAIRGVNVDGVLRTLVQRGYLGEVGRDEGPGQAVLFGTTTDFLDKLGLASLDQLPPLGDFVPGAHVVEALEETLRVGPPVETEPSEGELTLDSELIVDVDPVIDLTAPSDESLLVTPQQVVESLTAPRSSPIGESPGHESRSQIDSSAASEPIIDLDRE